MNLAAEGPSVCRNRTLHVDDLENETDVIGRGCVLVIVVQHVVTYLIMELRRHHSV